MCILKLRVLVRMCTDKKDLKRQNLNIANQNTLSLCHTHTFIANALELYQRLYIMTLLSNLDAYHWIDSRLMTIETDHWKSVGGHGQFLNSKTKKELYQKKNRNY
jgi:hypothetical protein